MGKHLSNRFFTYWTMANYVLGGRVVVVLAEVAEVRGGRGVLKKKN